MLPFFAVLNPATPTLQARKQQLVRDAIWDAAVDLFIQKGFDETTVDDIAEAAGVSRRSFFRYFSSKNDLMAHSVVSYATALNETIRAWPRDYSPTEVFRETVRKIAQQSPGPRTRRIMEIAAKYPAAREAQLSRLAELQDRVAEVYGQRCATAGPDDPAPHLLAALTLATLSTSFRSWFHSNGADISATVDNVLGQLTRLVCDLDRSTSSPKPGKTRASNRRPKRKRT
jgi:AcrR family transcriptional regulator